MIDRQLEIEEIVHKEQRASRTPLTDRTFEQYLFSLDITPEELGHHVLDIGSGRSEKFVDKLLRKGSSLYR